MKIKLLTTFLIATALGFGQTDTDKRLQYAAEALNDVMGIPDKTIPQELLNKSYCVMVVPNLKKGAFVFGAQYGKGFVMCRKKDNVGWTAPGAIRIEGGSFGLQIGGTETDVFMLVMNQRGMDRLLSSKFTLGGDAVAAAGPVGRATQAETDAAMTAEILTWSRARGLFAGISLKGSTLRPDDDDNKEMYGKSITNREILTGDVAAPKGAVPLLDDLNRYSSRK